MSDTKELAGLSGMKYLAAAPNNETIVGMTAYKDRLYVVTREGHLYVINEHTMPDSQAPAELRFETVLLTGEQG